MAHPQASIDYPGTWSGFLTWFADEASCIAFLERLRWPDGFVCPKCGSRKAWRIADGRWSCQVCVRKVSVTANTIFDRTRTPLRTWFAAAWYVTNQKYGASALGLQRVLGFGSYQTAWTMLHSMLGPLYPSGYPASGYSPQSGMTNEWLKSQGLIDIRAMWMKAHGYA